MTERQAVLFVFMVGLEVETEQSQKGAVNFQKCGKCKKDSMTDGKR